MDESGAGRGAPADRISSLPDDLLLHVLSHLGYADAAARKTLLSRRWRGLFSHLSSVDVTLCDVPLPSLEDALRRAARPGVRLLDIAVPMEDHTTTVSSERPGHWLAKDMRGPCGVEFTVQSFLLQGLVVDRGDMPTRGIVVQAPRLNRLTMSFKASQELSVTVVAPIVEKVSWRCSYAGVYHGLGLWCLLELRLETAEERRWWAGCRNANTGEDPFSPLHPSVNILSLRICCSIGFFDFSDEETRFATKVSKHMVTDFSGLELHLTAKGHMFGSFVWRLLGMSHIGKATRSLRIVLLRSQVMVACRPNCPCDRPSQWSIQYVCLPNLEKLEIEGFEGDAHEFEFLKLMLRRAPMLKRLTVRLPDQVTPNDDWCTKLYDIFAEYPYVEGNVDLIPGK